MVKMRLVLIALEYDAGTFSGNGVYAQSFVRGLQRCGHTLSIVCGAPASSPAGLRDGVWSVPLPSWGRLDRHSSYEAFGEQCGCDSALKSWVASLNVELVLGVDFSCLPAVDALFSCPSKLKLVLLVLRLFSRTDAGHEPLERAAASASAVVVALSRDDAAFLTSLLVGAHTTATSPLVVCNPPPLREDVRSLAAALQADDATRDGGARRRVLLSCVVRLSPEKEPHTFISLVEAMSKRGAFSRLPWVVPCLVGAPSTPYGRDLTARLVAAAPHAELQPAFLLPAALGALVFLRAALNIHPPKADAFGMTVLEAAAWGCPTALRAGCGASASLKPCRGEALFLLDAEEEATLAAAAARGASEGEAAEAHAMDRMAARVEAWLGDSCVLEEAGRLARERALASTEAAASEHVAALLQSVIDGRV